MVQEYMLNVEIFLIIHINCIYYVLIDIKLVNIISVVHIFDFKLLINF